MKKTILGVAVMIMVLGFITPVKAETSEKMLETRVRRQVSEFDYQIGDALIEREAKVRAIDYSVDYEAIGNGIYDICVEYIVYKNYEYEFHFIYDAYEEDCIATYGIKDGKRMDADDLADYIDEQFPGLL